MIHTYILDGHRHLSETALLSGAQIAARSGVDHTDNYDLILEKDDRTGDIISAGTTVALRPDKVLQFKLQPKWETGP